MFPLVLERIILLFQHLIVLIVLEDRCVRRQWTSQMNIQEHLRNHQEPHLTSPAVN